MNQNIVFFGSGWYTIPVIQKLIPHALDLVITTEKNPESQFLKFCNENNLQTLSVSSASDLLEHKSLITNHTVAILASYGALIPDEIINLFPNGIINIHPSLLPLWKGPSPIQYSLLNGDTKTGVTLIKLDSQIDHGPILSQKPYDLQGNETSQDLLSLLFEIGAEMVEEIVSKLENGEPVLENPQDNTHESWSYRIAKKDGMIDINDVPNTEKLQNMIRAYYPWPGVWFVIQLKGQTKIIKLLPEGKIQVEGKNPTNYKDFVNGFGDEGREILKKLNISI